MAVSVADDQNVARVVAMMQRPKAIRCMVGVVRYCLLCLVWLGTVRYGYERSVQSSSGMRQELRRNSKKARKKHSDPPLQASECFVPLLYAPAGGRGRSATNFELQTYSLVCSFTPPMVEVRGVEPLSETVFPRTSTSICRRSNSRL